MADSNVKDIARPHFYMDAVQNNSMSEKEGRPVFEEKEMVEIRIPGDKLMTWVGQVDEKHKQRWPEHYAAFKRGEARAATGTPLEQWTNPVMTRAKVAELKALDLLSVDELASVPDNLLSKMGPGARELRDQAKAYIDSAKSGATTAHLAAEVARLQEMVERLSGANEPERAASHTEADLQSMRKDKALEDCTDEELKAYIKRETGKAPAGRISRENLLKRAAEIATKAAA